MNESNQDKAARMQWWREARFGLFIHWGLYAIPAGRWGNRTNHGEWIRETAQIPLSEYEKLLPQFNPVKFDAARWVKLAKDAGMKYIVITTKHHDGFALFDSKYTKWDVMSTPFARDIMRELADAARKQGIKICWYHSIMDWHHPDYLPRRSWEEQTRTAADADMNRFTQYLHNQVTELLTNYGDIGVMWFDGEWESTWNHERGKALYELCRRLQPKVIVNNRVDVGRAGLDGFSDSGRDGDFGTPEQTIPEEGLPGVDWETCMTMNQHWGYNAADKNYKSTKELLQMLCDIVSKGGNFLLNVGPTAEGEFPPESVERLREIGEWMSVNNAAVYGTEASPFGKLPWGRCTAKTGVRTTKLYFHVFDFPKDGKLVIPGIGNKVLHAKLLKGAKRLEATRDESDIVISLPDAASDPHVTVVELEIEGRPVVYKQPTFSPSYHQFVQPIDITIDSGSTSLEIRYTKDGTEPTKNSARYLAPIRILETTTLRARAFHEDRPVSSISEVTYTKVLPWPAKENRITLEPLVSVYEGTWDKLPNFLELTPLRQESSNDITLGKYAGRENIALRFSGTLLVPSDDMYQFWLSSDDGSRLWIDGKLVVDNDGLHSMETRSGYAPLSAGKHSVEIGWFNKTGGAELEARFARAFRGEKPAPLRLR